MLFSAAHPERTHWYCCMGYGADIRSTDGKIKDILTGYLSVCVPGASEGYKVLTAKLLTLLIMVDHS